MRTYELEPSKLLLAWRVLLITAGLIAVLWNHIASEPTEQGPTDAQEQVPGLVQFALAPDDYETAVSRLRKSARNGDAEAQRLLGVLLLAGPDFFNTRAELRLCDARQWLRRAAASRHAVDAALELMNEARLRCADQEADLRITQ